MKTVCVGDIHLSDHPPVNATPDYTSDILQMLYWVADYSNEIRADAVVWAGDIFHHKAPSKNSHALVLRLIEVIQHFRKLGLEVCAVTGNHDIMYDNLPSVHESQPLGVLYRAGLQELSGWHPSLPLFGAPWRQDWTSNPEAATEAFQAWRECTPGENALAVTHIPMFPPALANEQVFDIVPAETVADAMGNHGSLYYGHIHDDHGVFKVNGVTFANVGALSRGSIAEYNLKRQVQIAVWEDGQFTPVAVPVAKPVEEILQVEKVAQEKAEQLSLDAFLEDIGRSVLDVSTSASILTYIQERKDIPEPVRIKAVEFIEKVG